jgi:hypothetical protein
MTRLRVAFSLGSIVVGRLSHASLFSYPSPSVWKGRAAGWARRIREARAHFTTFLVLTVGWMVGSRGLLFVAIFENF